MQTTNGEWRVSTRRRKKMSREQNGGSHCASTPSHTSHDVHLCREAHGNAQSERRHVKWKVSEAPAFHVSIRIDSSAAWIHGCGALCAHSTDTGWGMHWDSRG